MSELIVSRGTSVVERSELDAVEAPAPTATWFPLRHGQVLSAVERTLGDAGFNITRSRLALSRDKSRFFGTLDLATAITDGVTMAVGIRNSTDKSFPIGMCAGNRVFVCDYADIPVMRTGRSASANAASLRMFESP